MSYAVIKKEQTAAKNCQLKRFHSDIPCKHCGCEIRRTSSTSCVNCFDLRKAERAFKAKLYRAGISINEFSIP